MVDETLKSHIGEWIRLKGINHHGKNKISLHGDLWLIEKVIGNRAKLRSREETFKCDGQMQHAGCWLDLPWDQNFEKVEMVKGVGEFVICQTRTNPWQLNGRADGC